MSDLREALAQYDDGEAGTHQVSELAAAVRRFLALTETGLPRLVDALDDLELEIDTNGDLADVEDAWEELFDAAIEVRAALADYLTEEE